MNNFLKNRKEVDESTQFLIDKGLVQSGLSCKNWEIASVIPFLMDGNLIDLGSSGSVVLDNAVRLKLKGRKVGVDLVYLEDTVINDGIELFKGDLMSTHFPNSSFDIITSLSVIEHEVDFYKFAKECSRLLRVGGKLYCSFDFWEPKPSYEKRKLYNLEWNILDRDDVTDLVISLAHRNMEITSAIDWTTQDAVINDTYCSPVKDVSYTFGILEFIKK